MSCNCKKLKIVSGNATQINSNVFTDIVVQDVFPDTQCLQCVEKHISLAMTLYFNPTQGQLNDWFICGNLALAQLHSQQTWKQLSYKISLLRKKIYNEIEEVTKEDFLNLKKQIDKILTESKL